MTTEKHAARLYLDEPLMDWLRSEAKRRCCSISQVVRDLIVDRIGPPPSKEAADGLR